MGSVRVLSGQLRIIQAALAEVGALTSIQMWKDQVAEVAAVLEVVEDEALPMVAAVVTMMFRAGMEDEARAFAAANVIDLDQDNWFSLLNWCSAAEAGLVLGDRALAAAAYDVLAPYAGHSGCAGSGTTLGPVDAFLAEAAAAVGEQELAGRHADEAMRLCEAWQVPLVAQWLRNQRDRYSF